MTDDLPTQDGAKSSRVAVSARVIVIVAAVAMSIVWAGASGGIACGPYGNCPTTTTTRPGGTPTTTPACATPPYASDQRFTGLPGKDLSGFLAAGGPGGSGLTWVLTPPTFSTSGYHFSWSGKGTFGIRLPSRSAATFRYRVRDSHGCVSNTAKVTVVAGTFSFGLRTSPDAGSAPLLVGLVSDAPAVAGAHYVLSYGDGTSTAFTPGTTPLHTYAKLGTFTATLKALDGKGATVAAASSTVKVGPAATLGTDPLVRVTLEVQTCVGSACAPASGAGAVLWLGNARGRVAAHPTTASTGRATVSLRANTTYYVRAVKFFGSAAACTSAPGADAWYGLLYDGSARTAGNGSTLILKAAKRIPLCV